MVKLMIQSFGKRKRTTHTIIVHSQSSSFGGNGWRAFDSNGPICASRRTEHMYQRLSIVQLVPSNAFRVIWGGVGSTAYRQQQRIDSINRSNVTMATTAATTAADPAATAPLYIDTQHEDLVHDVQMDFYGAKMATCSSGKSKTTAGGRFAFLSVPLGSRSLNRSPLRSDSISVRLAPLLTSLYQTLIHIVTLRLHHRSYREGL
jgi:hypothetical protein